MATVTVEQTNVELTKQLSLLRQRNKQLGNIVDVEKDIVIKSREIQTAAGAVKQQYESVKESVFSGLESFTTGMFGGPIGGLISTLTIGTWKRKKENAKIAAEKQKEEEKQIKKDKALNKKSLETMAEKLMWEEVEVDGVIERRRLQNEFGTMLEDEVIEKIKAKQKEKEDKETKELILAERKKALEFMKAENAQHEQNGGTPDNGGGDGSGGNGADTGGVVTAIGNTNQLLKEGFGLSSPPYLETLVKAMEEQAGTTKASDKVLNAVLKIAKGQTKTTKDTEKHLQYMADNSETAEDRRERMRAEKAGGVTAKTAKGEGDKKGLFGDFKFMDIFKKGGIKKLITSLGGTLFGGLTSAFGSTGVVGKSLLTKMGPMLMKVAGPAALLAGIALAVKDGMMGYAKSEEWGVSKFSGTLGGILGGEDKGLKGAMWGGMKWALIGAGIGSVFPVVGTLIGGALGALLGAILGYFGGEKIAKAIDAMGAWFDEKWNGFLSIFGLGDDKKTAEAEKKASKDKVDIDKKRLQWTEKEIGRLEELGDEATPEQKKRLETLKGEAKQLGSRIKERELSSGPEGSGLTKAEREKELTELTASREETTGFMKGDVKGLEESADDLAEAEEKYQKRAAFLQKQLGEAFKGKDPYSRRRVRSTSKNFPEYQAQFVATAEGMIASADANIKEKREAHQWMVDRIELLKKESQAQFDMEKGKTETGASGGFIVTRPTYLPSSGVVVGEHPTYSGRGAYTGGIPDGGEEAITDGKIIPFGADRADAFIDPMGRSIAGAVMNQMMMERVGGAVGGPAQSPTIIDNSTVQNVSNNTMIRSPSPSGPSLHFEGRDFVHKVA